MTIAYDPNNRNGDLDEFLTPPELILACIKLTQRHYRADQHFTVLDVGCNMGQWGTVVRKLYPHAHITGVEYMDVPPNPAFDVWVPNQDFLAWAPEQKFDLIVSNPAYSNYIIDPKTGKRIRKSVAEKIVRHGLELLKPDGFQYYLLRASFRHSRERLWADRRKRQIPGIHQIHHYLECHAIIPRPSFYVYDKREKKHYGHRRTNSYEYDLYVWSGGWKSNFGFTSELDWEYNEAK